MASLPPRKNITTSKISRQSITPLQILLQMGFPKHRAEKALASTGDQGTDKAVNWLLKHVNDPTLDDSLPREYILYLCPTGTLLEQLQDFFTQSMIQCGRNGAHNYLPHITLCSFFQAPDDCVPSLVYAMKHVAEKMLPDFPKCIELQHYTSKAFMGIFVAEKHNDALKKLAVQFMREVSDFIVSEMGPLDVLGTCFPWCSSSYPSLSKGTSRKRIQVDPYLKSLHITLAYQFLPEHASTLEELAVRIDPKASATWELRLYSRDIRVKGNEVHKVLYSYVPQVADELEMIIGDCVYVNGEILNSTAENWVEGTSWMTGFTGALPKNYIEKTAESDVWSLHSSYPLNRPPLDEDTIPGIEQLPQDLSLISLEKTDAAPIRTSKLKKELAQKRLSLSDAPRKLFVMRHAERIDFTFGHTWLTTCFDIKGNFIRKDLNMPISIPPRFDSPYSYKLDSPLTMVGLYQASLTGLALKESKVPISHVFCSPSLRCIQTCTNLLKSANLSHLPINIEPGLFEWLAWYQEYVPKWMTIPELERAGFIVNTEYVPIVKGEELRNKNETCEQYYFRSFYVSQAAIKNTAAEGGNILFVGHSATLDCCTRQLCGNEPRNSNKLLPIVHKIPYCGFIAVEEKEDGWNVVPPPIMTLRHTANAYFDWQILNS